MSRLEHQPSAEFQIAKAHFRWITIVERSDRRRIDDDAHRPGCQTRGSDGNNDSEDKEQESDNQRTAAEKAQATRLRRLGLRDSVAACSSNSSASFSVIAPPSSSASTIVTARR